MSPEPTKKLLDAAIVVLAAVLLLIVALGGIDYDWGILRIRLHSVSRPLLLLGAALALRALHAWTSKIDAVHIATRGMLALLLTAAAIYATYQVRVCGGLDSYGYVSTSALIASGRLTQPQPLVAYLPFKDASSAVAPLGYVAGPGGHTEVPRFPLGLPIVMAGFRIFGPTGPFYVPLVMAYFTIALSYLIGASGAIGLPAEAPLGAKVGARGLPAEAAASLPAGAAASDGAAKSSDGAAKAGATLFGLLAAVLVAVDPLMVDYGMQPMSDVPAACWLLAAVWFRGIVDRRSSSVDRQADRRWTMDDGRWTILAGVCAGMAFLTRPALLPAAIAIGVVTLDRPLKDSIRYAMVLFAFIVLQMGINVVLYGSVRTSGYGPTSYMFELSAARFMANAANFGKWLTYSHTFLIWLVWPMSMWVLRSRQWAWRLSAVAAAGAAPYLFYLVFDDWESSRFVLPSILLVLILTAAALGELFGPSNAPSVPAWRRPLIPIGTLALAFACAAASHLYLQRQDVYRLWDLEAKYPLVGEWIDAHLPSRAVVFAGQHSGSIRYYGHRQTIRWDQMPSDKMSVSLHNLAAAGYEPYLALDVASEPPLFEERFRQDSAVRVEQIGRVRVVNFYRFVSVP